MNKLEKLEDLKSEVQELERGYTNKREELLLKTGVIIEKFFNSSPKYHDVLRSITLHLIGFNSGASTVSKTKMWETGKYKFIGLIDTLIYDLKLSEDLKNEEKMNKFNEKDCSKVFIVHGHDDGTKNEVARYIERLGFEAIILHEQVSASQTIIESIETYTDVGYGIVIYSGCDIGGVKSKPESLSSRARQNVVFEHGFLMGKIGRNNVIALVKDNVEMPSDISGIVYQAMDSSGAWKLKLAKEMRASGYDIDMNKVL